MVVQNITGERRCVISTACDDPNNETCRFELAALEGQLWQKFLAIMRIHFVQRLDKVDSIFCIPHRWVLKKSDKDNDMKLIIEEKEFNLLLDESSNIIAAVLEAKRLSEKYNKDFFDCEDLIKIMNIGRDNIRNLFRDNSFPSKKIGNRHVINVLAFILWSCNLIKSSE